VAANIIRRVAANDPAVTRVILADDFHDGDMTALSVAIRGNTCLHKIKSIKGAVLAARGGASSLQQW
jgi:hypothetical protein